MTDRSTDLRGYIVGNGDKTKWRAWRDGAPIWVDDPVEACRYGFRSDANAVHAEDEDAWCIVPYRDVLFPIHADDCEAMLRPRADCTCTPSARITGDKDRETPAIAALRAGDVR